MPGYNDFANYRKMSEPFENAEQASEAMQAFFDAVNEARKKHRIMDVHVIVKMNIMRGPIGEEVEGSALASAHFGNTLEGAPMCAWGLGHEQADFEASLQRASKSG